MNQNQSLTTSVSIFKTSSIIIHTLLLNVFGSNILVKIYITCCLECSLIKINVHNKYISVPLSSTRYSIYSHLQIELTTAMEHPNNSRRCRSSDILAQALAGYLIEIFWANYHGGSTTQSLYPILTKIEKNKIRLRY